MSFDGFVFLDIETTGTDFDRDAVLEIGVLLASPDLEPLDSQYWITKTERSAAAMAELYAGTSFDSTYVQQMHSVSGLTAEFDAHPGGITAAQYTAQIVDWLTERGATGLPMCGSTISFDRTFLRANHPEARCRVPLPQHRCLQHPRVLQDQAPGAACRGDGSRRGDRRGWKSADAPHCGRLPLVAGDPAGLRRRVGSAFLKQ